MGRFTLGVSTMLKVALASLGALVALAACDSPKTQPVSPPSASPAAPAPQPTPTAAASASAAEAATPTVPAHMKEHFTKAEEMKAAILRGDLAGFREVAAWMAEHELSADPPADWKKYTDAMQLTAKGARDAKDLKAASAALAAVGQSCADCHGVLGGPKQLELGEPPAEGSGAALHMVRHQWAADKLWLGLMAPSEEAWVKGAEVFADAPLSQEQAAPGKSVSPKVKAMATKVHEQAHRARTVDKAKRAQAYAELMQSCSSCHELARQ